MRNGWLGAGLLMVAAPARAECLGACADALTATIFSMVVYGLIGIVLLVMLIRAKWRRSGLWGLGLVLLLAIGVPLLSQAWNARQLRALAGHEVVGTPPALASRVPLLVTPDDYCEDSACEAVLRGRGAAGVHVLLSRSLDGVDLTARVALADLPIELWVQTRVGGDIRRVALSPDERQAAAARIDYLVVTSWPYFPAEPGPVEAALRTNPRLRGMGGGAAVRLLMAPLAPGKGMPLAEVQPDLLDLSLLGKPLAIPLAPRNWQRSGNTVVGAEVAARSICPANDPSGNCLSLLMR